MSKAAIDKLHKSIATDFKIVARKTDLWEIEDCYTILHDIKKFMLFGYITSVSVILLDSFDNALKVKKYQFDGTSRNTDQRPGGIDWEEGEGYKLNVVVTWSHGYVSLSPLERESFRQNNNINFPWGPSGIDTDFPHLNNSLSKRYIHTDTGIGINRVDFN